MQYRGSKIWYRLGNKQSTKIQRGFEMIAKMKYYCGEKDQNDEIGLGEK